MAMSKTTVTMSEHDDIEMLLPWYVTGKLDAADHARVEAWVRNTPDLARQVDLLRAEQDATLRINEALRAPASLTIERTLAAASSPRHGNALSRIAAIVREFFTLPSAGMVRSAAIAAGVVMLLQAAAVGYLLSERPKTTYQQASGGQNTTLPGSYALVRFADTASAKDVAAALAELGVSIVDGPHPGALFRVRLGAAGLNDTERDARIEALRRRNGLVALITPAP